MGMDCQSLRGVCLAPQTARRSGLIRVGDAERADRAVQRRQALPSRPKTSLTATRSWRGGCRSIARPRRANPGATSRRSVRFHRRARGSDATAPVTEQAPAFQVALGIPQGVIADPPSRSLAGTVRRGGELVSLSPDDYDVWGALLTPRSTATLAEIASMRGWGDTTDVLRRLKDMELVAKFDPTDSPNEQFARLRPIPRGVGAGNLEGEAGIFQIKDAQSSQSTPLSVDAVTVMVWWEFDGAASLAKAVTNVAARLPDLRENMIEMLAVRLVLRLMAQRLIHLDTTYDASEPRGGRV
jgi:hypothetical protein